MKTVEINQYRLDFYPIPKGHIQYRIEWDKKPHRNQFVKKGVDRFEINIQEDVFVSETPITQGIWSEIMDINPSKFKGQNKPVENVSYNEILDFIDKLKVLTNQSFRLLKESEFIYICMLNYGEEFKNKLDEWIWFEQNSGKQTHAVASKPPGNLHLSDVLGNVYHFVENDITKLPSGKCLYKGACWATQALWVDKDYSMKLDNNSRDNTIGFRLVLMP